MLDHIARKCFSKNNTLLFFGNVKGIDSREVRVEAHITTMSHSKIYDNQKPHRKCTTLICWILLTNIDLVTYPFKRKNTKL
jgi:hypothetical protein